MSFTIYTDKHNIINIVLFIVTTKRIYGSIHHNIQYCTTLFGVMFFVRLYDSKSIIKLIYYNLYPYIIL